MKFKVVEEKNIPCEHDFAISMPDCFFQLERSSDAFVVYAIYLGMAGAGCEGYEDGQGPLKRYTNGKLAKINRELSRPLEKLGGKPLIKIQGSTITIVDIEKENEELVRKFHKEGQEVAK